MTTTTIAANWRFLPGLLVRLLICLPIAAALAAGLTDTQRQTASALAEAIAWPAPVARTAQHPLGLQTLSVEIQEQKNRQADARVRVYQYHYDYRTTRVLVFDLLHSELMEEKLINSVHLPLNEQEIRFASTLLSQRANVVERLRDEQRRRGQTAFSALSELDVKASIFEPLDSSHPCASQRCALLSLFDDTRTVFSVEPIVNLQILDVQLLATQ